MDVEESYFDFWDFARKCMDMHIHQILSKFDNIRHLLYIQYL